MLDPLADDDDDRPTTLVGGNDRSPGATFSEAPQGFGEAPWATRARLVIAPLCNSECWLLPHEYVFTVVAEPRPSGPLTSQYAAAQCGDVIAAAFPAAVAASTNAMPKRFLPPLPPSLLPFPAGAEGSSGQVTPTTRYA